MKKTEQTKAYYFFDEAGDTTILGRKGVNLVESGLASKVFMVGYLETKYAVENLLENRLHLYSEIDCYFSSLGNVVRKDTMQSAINSAIERFKAKWNKENSSSIRIFIQQSKERPLLQASDYVLWTIQRAYEKGDFRYYNYLKEKICLVHDILDTRRLSSNYYTPKNPLDKKIDPV